MHWQGCVTSNHLANKNYPNDTACLSHSVCKYYFSCELDMHHKYPGQGLLSFSLTLFPSLIFHIVSCITLYIASHLFLNFSGHDIKNYQFVVKHFLVVLPQGISTVTLDRNYQDICHCTFSLLLYIPANVIWNENLLVGWITSDALCRASYSLS